MPPADLTEEQRLIARTAGDLAESFAADAFEWRGDTPWENIRTLADRGFYCMSIPEKYGGGGASVFEDILVMEAVTPVCPDTGWALMNATIAPRYVALYGTEEAKERYLPPVTNGETQMAIAISEPGAGSDVGAMNTELEPADDGGYYVTGEKTWVTNVGTSETAVLWTRLPGGNIGSVILEFDADGVEVLTEYTNMAGHAQTHFVLEDVYIPPENVLITDRDDWREQLARLNWDRVAIATWTNAVARCAIEMALEYAEEREQFGRPIAEFQGIQWKLADMVTQYEAGRSLVYRTASDALAEDRVPSRLESSLAKYHTAANAEEIVSEALQIHGANGYQQGHPLEYLYRFVRSRRIGHGTDEVLKTGIADRVREDGLLD